jgi:RNA polymerase sigma-70 factor (ECF subfamily)
VCRLRSGNADAASLLDELYRDPLARFCWGYLGCTEEAEDALQDIWYKILTASHIPDAFRPWVYRIARNECLNLLRKRAKRKDGQELPAPSQVDAYLTGQLTRLVKAETESRLTELVAGLSDPQREALRLRYVEGLTRVEIAEVLEIPASVVKSRIFEGLKRLRDQASLLDSA